jgi:hypothetical protein
VKGALARHHGKIVAGGEQRGPRVVGVGVTEADASVADLSDGGRDAARLSGRRRPREGGPQDVVEAGQVGVVGEAGEHAVHGPAQTLAGCW